MEFCAVLTAGVSLDGIPGNNICKWQANWEARFLFSAGGKRKITLHTDT